jgi:hypothetical protein
VPPAPSTETTANCAEPANVVADMTSAANESTPAALASTPKEAPKATIAGMSGSITRIPSLYLASVMKPFRLVSGGRLPPPS